MCAGSTPTCNGLHCYTNANIIVNNVIIQVCLNAFSPNIFAMQLLIKKGCLLVYIIIFMIVLNSLRALLLRKQYRFALAFPSCLNYKCNMYSSVSKNRKKR